MSKIAITPNASGTGTFTIAAPNSNTDRTLTLPDAAGAVVIDEAGGGSVKIDSNGNMGIGTSSPNATLEVTAATNNGLVRLGRLQFKNSSGSYINGTDGVHIFPFSDGMVYQDNFDGGFAWRTVASTERMRIDSAGNVTKPYQPMFLGYPTNDYSSGGGMPIGVMSVTALHNNGGHFNASNSRFTAPVAGWYLTTWGGLQLANTVTSLMINGTRTHSGNHFVTTPAYSTVTQTAIRYLNAGDYLNIEQWNGGGYYSGWYLWSVTLLG